VKVRNVVIWNQELGEKLPSLLRLLLRDIGTNLAFRKLALLKVHNFLFDI